MVTVATDRPTGCQSPAPALSQVNRHLLVNRARCQLQMAPMTPFDTINGSYKWLQWPHLTPSSGRFFQKVTDRWADHRNQLLVRTGTLKCLAKPNPAAIPSNDLLLSKNPANEPILVNCTNEVIENESKLPVWTTATLTRLHKWYLISSPWTPIAPQMRPSNLNASGSCNFKDKKDT